MSNQNGLEVDEAAFHADVQYIESLWRRRAIGSIDLPVIDKGQGEPLVFVPILEHIGVFLPAHRSSQTRRLRTMLTRWQLTAADARLLLGLARELSRVLQIKIHRKERDERKENKN